MSLAKADLYLLTSLSLVQSVARSKPSLDLKSVTFLSQPLAAYSVLLGWLFLYLTRALVMAIQSTNSERPLLVPEICNYTATTDLCCSNRCQVLPRLPRLVLSRHQLCLRCLCYSYLSLDRFPTVRLKPCYRCLGYRVFRR